MDSYSVNYILSAPILIAAYILLFKAFLGKISTSKIKFFIAILVYFIIDILLMLLKLHIIPVAIFNFSYLIFIAFLYKGSYTKKVFSGVAVFMISFVINILSAKELSSVKFNQFFINLDTDNIEVVMARISIVFYAYFIYEILGEEKNTENREYYKEHYIAYIVILMGMLYLFLIASTGKNTGDFQVYFSGVIVLFVVGFIIFNDRNLYRLYEDKIKSRILEEQNESFLNQKEILERSSDEIQSIRHDIKNHMIALKYKMNNDEDVNDYIDDILIKTEGEKFSNTGNFIIDGIINYKLQYLEEVKINCDIKSPKEIRISAYNLAIIIGNLLDNAIQALKKLEGDKELDFKLSYSKGNLIIIIKNTFNGDVFVKDNEYKSTNYQDENRGYGILNVKKVIEKCGGEVNFSHTENEFSVWAVIPAEEN